MIKCPVKDCGERSELAICGTHRGYLSSSLTGLPMYYVQLHSALAFSAAASEKVAGTRTPPLPMNATARALQEDMITVTTRAEDDYRFARAWSPTPNRGREGRRLMGATKFLVVHLDGLLALSWGGDFARDVFRIVGATRHTLGLDSLVHRLPAPCPTCDMLALERKDGADRVVCGYCGRVFGEDDYLRLVLILASEL